MTGEQLLLGVDGGGSKTVAWLAVRGQGECLDIVGRGAAGASNPVAVGVPAACRALDEVVADAFRDAGRPVACVAAAVLGLAGSDRDDVRAAIEDWLARRTLARRWRIVPDALPVLEAVAGGGPAIALVSGTGSLALGRDARGRTARAGGWGWLFGDEGSGFALGRAALQAVAAAADGRGPATQLTDAVLSAFQIDALPLLASAVHAAADTRHTIAGLAPLVTQAAASGDPVATSLLDSAAADLALLVAAVATRLGLAAAPFPLALSGGTLLSCTRLSESVLGRLRALDLRPEPVTRVAEPVAGAVALARGLVIE